MNHKSDDLAKEQPAADAAAAAPFSRPPRSGEGMDSLIRHLREHHQQRLDHLPDERATDQG